MAVRLPETPSTPSEQLVALIETQIRPVASGSDYYLIEITSRSLTAFAKAKEAVAATPDLGLVFFLERHDLVAHHRPDCGDERTDFAGHPKIHVDPPLT